MYFDAFQKVWVTLVLINPNSLTFHTCSQCASADKLQTEYMAGQYGSDPWGDKSGFYDTAASWIWNSPGANNTAIAETVAFGASYYNPKTAPVPATLILMVDNKADVYLNKALLMSTADGTWKMFLSYPRIPIVLGPGVNEFVFIVTNVFNPNNPLKKNPAGLIYSLIATDGTSLIRSGFLAGKNGHVSSHLIWLYLGYLWSGPWLTTISTKARNSSQNFDT